MPILRNRKKPE
jgi:hypothetical protein